MAISADIKELIKKFALKNALDYGKAIEGSVISRIISKDPSLKSNMPELSREVKRSVTEINKMKKEEQEREFSKYADEFKNADTEKAERSAKHNFSIYGAEKGSFVTRFPPEPGGYMHIGHAKPTFIEDELRKIYDGKLMLYFDDTNPDNERQEFVDAFKDDFKWLGIKFDGEYYASDNIPKLYGYASEAMGKEKAYVCTCDGEKIKESRASGKTCEHKTQGKEKNLDLWKKMLDGEFGGNGAILRLNSDMKALNTTMRDPTLFRIKESKHYRQKDKYTVWPTYDFCTPIIDSIMGITDVIRSKEYELRDELYFAVLDLLGLRKPRITSFSRLEIANNVTSKRRVRELMAQKLIQSYDDPRLVTIRALKRRGIRAQAIKEFALSFGMGKSESKVDISMLLSYNRKIIESTAKHLFFVPDPVKINIEGIPESKKRIKLRLHPSAELGFREYAIDNAVYVNMADLSELKKGDKLRLKDAFTIKLLQTDKKSVKAVYVDDQSHEIIKTQWVSEGSFVEAKLLNINPLLKNDEFNKDSIETIKGYAENHSKQIEENDIVQFERIGFYKFDDKKAMAFLSL